MHFLKLKILKIKPRRHRTRYLSKKRSLKIKRFLFARLIQRLRFSGRLRLLRKYKRKQKRRILRQRLKRLLFSTSTLQRSKKLRILLKKVQRQSNKRRRLQLKVKKSKVNPDVTQSFIKGRNYFTEMEPPQKRKFKVRRPLRKLKRKISRNFEKSLNRIKRKKNRANYHFNSYFAKYLRHRRFRRRTRYVDQEHHWKNLGSSESQNFYEKLPVIKRDEFRRARWLGRKVKPRYRYRRTSRRYFTPAQVCLTHKRRNSFGTLMQRFEYRGKAGKRVYFKTSCGLMGYKGPKRPTKYAREATIENLGHVLARDEFTTVDINFTRVIGRKFYPYIKRIFQGIVYVKSIRVAKRRSHGFTRLKKAKRK